MTYSNLLEDQLTEAARKSASGWWPFPGKHRIRTILAQIDRRVPGPIVGGWEKPLDRPFEEQP